MADFYISVKGVHAEKCPAWKKYGEYDVGAEGYKIYYKDGYVSWCPKEEFERQYLHLDCEDKITQHDVDTFIDTVKDFKIGDKTTVVQATCKNGFVLTDSSSCVDKENFDMNVGKLCCMHHIADKVWFLLGFLLQSAETGFNHNMKEGR